MLEERSHSSRVLVDEALRLPRPPGVIRRFWARHPVLTDVLIALVCLLLSFVPAVSSISYRGGTPDADTASSTVTAPVFSAVALVAIVVACATLLLRRRLPLLPLAATTFAQLAILPVPAPTAVLPLTVAVYSLAAHRSNRSCWVGLGASCAIVAAVALLAYSGGVADASAMSNAIAGTALAGLFGALVGINVGNRKRYLEAIIDRSRQLLVERDQQAELAAAAERARIAREMHDIVAHSLTGIVALAEGASATADERRAREATDAAAATARQALGEMRGMLGVLRAGEHTAPLAPADPVSPHDTVAAARRAGFPVTLTMTGDAPPPPAVQYAVGRIVQEGITNVMRHAPRATDVRVRVDSSSTRVRIEISNDGAHRRSSPTGFGIPGLAERAAHVGGTLHSGPVGDGRWLLHADLPLYAAPGAPQRAEVTASSRDTAA